MIRLFDIVLSILGCIVLSPILLILSIWIKLDSKGPVFYKQVRVGKNGKDFILYKYRSMKTGSDKKGLLTVGGNDSRITRSGTFIRKFKLDELPQLFNVISGKMSLVGPRPEVRKYVDMTNPIHIEILTVKPGITDYASIKYSNENEILGKYTDPEKAYIEIVLPDKLQLSLDYIRNYTLLNYLKIIFQTLKQIIK